ncbi:hypothetical protein P885DRAFT_43191 [Corynascus similis CBS 632.67]
MTRQTFITLASAALAIAHSARAEILSCADVECPIPNPNVTSSTCTVADKTFNAVGILNLDTGRIYDQAFYLGTPEDFDFDDTGACALFFTEVSDRVKFGNGDVRNTQGTCGQALSDSCVSALTDRAKKVDLKGLSSRAACEKMQKDFSDNLDSACSAVAQGDRWTGIKAKALSGNASPERISGRQNSTSNCWPVLPKTHDLTLIESINKTSLVSEPVAQLTCLKTIDLTTASNDTKSPNGGDDEGASSRMAGNGALAICAVLSTLFVLLG